MSEPNNEHLTPEEFSQLDPAKVTLVDLRDPNEGLIKGIPGSLNIPFNDFAAKIDSLPKDKPVYAFCRVGDWSSQVVEILRDRGYEAYDLAGGYEAYEKYKATLPPLFIDAKGLKCPGPIVKIADTLKTLNEGDEVLVEATEDAFYSDIQVWATRTGNTLEKLDPMNKDGVIRALVKKTSKPAETITGDIPHDKNFVVFSDDLDKTIAVFIMANGALAMGRKVTIFFTFWGLNILRRAKKAKVRKTLIEKMFGFMMPRGTKKLHLSQMNMGGIGPKMIRGIMKKKNIQSLEELIEQALAHGARIVACQMSMDIMGIHKEELIDGVELGGVSTFLGAGETSDMSLFI